MSSNGMRVVTCRSEWRAGLRFASSMIAAGWVLLAGCDSDQPTFSPSNQPSRPTASAVQDQKEVIMGLERDWTAALSRKDLAWYQRNLSPTYQTVLGNGRVLSKSEVIEHMRTAPPAQGLKLDQADVRVHGDTAVAVTTQSFTRRDGRTARLRVTDVWTRSETAQWVAVHTHESLIADDQ